MFLALLPHTLTRSSLSLSLSLPSYSLSPGCSVIGSQLTSIKTVGAGLKQSTRVHCTVRHSGPGAGQAVVTTAAVSTLSPEASSSQCPTLTSVRLHSPDKSASASQLKAFVDRTQKIVFASGGRERGSERERERTRFRL